MKRARWYSSSLCVSSARMQSAKKLARSHQAAGCACCPNQGLVSHGMFPGRLPAAEQGTPSSNSVEA